MSYTITRNVALELVRTTEAAALSASRFMGRGDKIAADQAAVDGMRRMLQTVPISGVVVIGEGEKDEAPMLYIGEEVGAGGPQVDIAVDPIDGTTLISKGMPNSVSVIAMADRGSMYYPPHIFYMDKIATGPEAAGVIDITATTAENLGRVAEAKQMHVNDLTVVVLDRPRHEKLIAEIRATGARVKLISDGDVGGSLMAARPGTGIDLLMGVGGSPEAVITAAAMKCLGGAIQARPWPRNQDEREKALAAGVDVEQVLTTDDLIRSDDVYFAGTGITDGEVMQGVKYSPLGATTHSIVMRSRSGTIRTVEALHQWRKIEQLTGIA